MRGRAAGAGRARAVSAGSWRCGAASAPRERDGNGWTRRRGPRWEVLRLMPIDACLRENEVQFELELARRAFNLVIGRPAFSGAAKATSSPWPRSHRWRRWAGWRRRRRCRARSPRRGGRAPPSRRGGRRERRSRSPPLSGRRGRRATRRATAGAARSSSERPSWRRPSPMVAGAAAEETAPAARRPAAQRPVARWAAAAPANHRRRLDGGRRLRRRLPLDHLRARLRVEARLVDADEDAQALRQRLLAEGGDGVLRPFLEGVHPLLLHQAADVGHELRRRDAAGRPHERERAVQPLEVGEAASDGERAGRALGRAHLGCDHVLRVWEDRAGVADLLVVDDRAEELRARAEEVGAARDRHRQGVAGWPRSCGGCAVNTLL